MTKFKKFKSPNYNFVKKDILRIFNVENVEKLINEDLLYVLEDNCYYSPNEQKKLKSAILENKTILKYKDGSLYKCELNDKKVNWIHIKLKRCKELNF